MAVPDESALDFGELERVGGVDCHKMFWLPMACDFVDAADEVGGFHGRLWSCLACGSLFRHQMATYGLVLYISPR